MGYNPQESLENTRGYTQLSLEKGPQKGVTLGCFCKGPSPKSSLKPPLGSMYGT